MMTVDEPAQLNEQCVPFLGSAFHGRNADIEKLAFADRIELVAKLRSGETEADLDAFISSRDPARFRRGDRTNGRA